MKIYCKRLPGLSSAKSPEAFLCRGFLMSCPGVGSHDRWEWGEWRREPDGCPAFPWLARAWRLTARQKWPRKRFGNENRNSPETCQNDTKPGLFFMFRWWSAGYLWWFAPLPVPWRSFCGETVLFPENGRVDFHPGDKKQKSPPGNTRRAYKRWWWPRRESNSRPTA